MSKPLRVGILASSSRVPQVEFHMGVGKLTEAGFETVTVHRGPDLSHGIWWPEPWSFPLSARRPKHDGSNLKVND